MSTLASHIIAQVSLPANSGLPEDNYCNTFHFRNVGSSDLGDMSTRITERLSDFYTVQGATSSKSIVEYISGRHLKPDADVYAQVKVYDGSLPTGDRIPVISSFVLTGLTISTQLPTEVALCLSFVAERNQPRKRGRVYLGPLTVNSGLFVGAGEPRPIAACMNTWIDAGARLKTVGLTEQAAWVVYSPTSNTMNNVTGGWCDNSYDTQRRRGAAPTNRTLFGTFTS